MLVAGVAGCSSDMDELDAYINKVKARQGGRIEPLPEITQYVDFAYIADAQGFRSPFQPDSPQVNSSANGTRPDLERSREYLETFPLDTLSMVGTMRIGDTNYGLVLAAVDGLIHRVTPGNYVGQNDGRITEISESEIVVVEIISDGIGGYIERDAAVRLKD
jgi:type IV pilus assembly protein PilP